ncbi:hypothetical protein TD95_003262 [Thielaviopsis punctulata]|uniref:Malate dehydrogenase n=1 Tax=Thielaviopsis punctulata TaxID=72032 RepID=A0A0F4Z8R4_9PEZI|nr:hypothetical protein TD95_003262 [Thielaviopsis punctulata]
MLFLSSLLLASASLAAAAPSRRSSSCKAHAVSLPTNSNGTPLPSPPAGLSLKYIGLGHGYQNYTCATAGSSPVATGALAILYDALPLYPGHSPSSLSLSSWLALPAAALSTPIALNLSPFTPHVALSAEGASVSPFPASPAPLSLTHSLPAIGKHFFDATGTPNFFVGPHDHMVATKLAAQNAPSDAPTGPHGEAAVTWLYLGDKGNSTGLSAVYRVETAAGQAHECTQAGEDSSVYAAFYFFYGAK